MKNKFFSMFAIAGLAMSTTLSLSLLTACDDDDNATTEEVSADNSEADTDDNSTDTSDSASDTDSDGNIIVGTAVDLGLSVKWADINIGATLPADYGNYYAWGETETKDYYNFSNSRTWLNSSLDEISGNANYDAATANWGGTWRMPTEEECQELIDSCTWTQSTQENSNGRSIKGCKVVGVNGNSIFLPGAGFHKGSSPFTDNGRPSGYYLSSTIRANDFHYSYVINYGYYNPVDPFLGSNYKYIGTPVRPVTE